MTNFSGLVLFASFVEEEKELLKRKGIFFVILIMADPWLGQIN